MGATTEAITAAERARRARAVADAAHSSAMEGLDATSTPHQAFFEISSI